MATLQHRWKFDAHLKDNVGSSDSSFLGNGRLDRNVNAIFGAEMLDCSGTNAGAETGSVTLGDEFSVSFWIYRSSYAANYFAIGNANYQANGWSVWIDGSSNYIRFRTSNGTTHAESISSSVTWSGLHHIVVTCDRSTGDNVSIYLDGVDVSSTDDDCRTDFSLSGALNLGIDFSDANDFGGYIDDVQIYSDELTSTEVANMTLNAGTATGGDPDDAVKEIIHRWRFASYEREFGDTVGSADASVVGTASTTTSGEIEGNARLDNDQASNSGLKTDTPVNMPSGKFSVGMYWQKWGGSGKLAMFGNLDSAGDNDGFFVYWDYTNTRIEVLTKNAGGTDSATAYSDAPSYTTGTWYHIAVSFDRDAGTVRIFQDGVDITSTDDDCRTDFKLSGEMQFGLDFDNAGDSWAYIDDIQVYQGDLDAADWDVVQDQPGFTFHEGTTDLIARYKFDSDSLWADDENNYDLVDIDEDGITFEESIPDPKEGDASIHAEDNGEIWGTTIPLDVEHWSFAFWMYVDDISGTDLKTIISNYWFQTGRHNGSAIDGGIMLWFYEASDYILLRLYYTVDSYYTVRTSTSSIAANTWYHVVVAYDRATGITNIYLDGTDDTYSDGTGTELIKANAPFSFLSRRASTLYPFDGNIDDFQIYNIQLSAAQAAFLAANAGETIYAWKGSVNMAFSVSGAIIDKAGDPITGSVAASFSTTAHLSGKKEASGTIASAFSTAGDLIGTQTGFSGTIASAFTASGSVIGTQTGFSGTITPTFITAAGLSGYNTNFSGSINAVFSVTGNLTNSAMAGVVNSVFTVSGDIVGRGSLSGTSTPAFTTSGKGILRALITGTVTSVFSTAGDWIATARITGTSTPAFSTNAQLTNAATLSGIISFAFSTNGDLTYKSHTEYITGTVTISSTTSAAIVGRSELTGTVASSFLVEGGLKGRSELAGTVLSVFDTHGDALLFSRTSGVIASAFSTQGVVKGRSELSATSTSVFSTNAILTAIQPVSGTVSLVFGVTGFVGAKTRKEYITGSVDAAFSVSGNAILYGLIYGTSEASFSTAGHITATVSVSGTVNPAFNTAGHITAVENLAGTIAFAFTTQADLGYATHKKHISGSIDAIFAVSGNISTGPITKHISGSIVANFALNASVRATGLMSGSVDAAFGVFGNLTRFQETRYISGTVAVAFSTSATITHKVGHQYISGSVGSAFTTSGILKGYAVCSGSAHIQTDVAGAVRGRSALSGSVAVTFGVTGDIQAQAGISGTVATAFSTTASIHAYQRSFAGTVAIGFSTQGSVQAVQKNFAGVIASAFTMNGYLSGKQTGFAGSVTMATSTSGVLKGHVYGSGTIAVAYSTSGSMRGRAYPKPLPINMVFGVSGKLVPSWKLSGTVSSRFSTSGHLNSKADITASVASYFGVSGKLVGRTSLSSTVSMNFVNSASLKGVGLLGGSTVTRFVLEGILRAKGVVFPDVINGFVIDDLIKCSVLEPNFEGFVREVALNCSVIEPNFDAIIDDPEMNLRIWDQGFDGVMDEEETNIVV